MSNVSCINDDECLGCSACTIICNKNALSMKQSRKGFYTKSFTDKQCIDCGLCANVCPLMNAKKRLECFSPKAYAVKNNDEETRKESTSGGAFSAFVEGLYETKAVIYGAAFVDKRIKHLRVENGDISPLRKSKYVQSDLNVIYQKVINDLRANRVVLFCGNPCQCDGLKRLLECKGILQDNLYLVDFICHGVLSPILYDEYLKYCERIRRKQIKNHIFREKEYGWHTAKSKIIYDDGSSSNDLNVQIIMDYYFSGLGLKNACYSCKYTSINRVSDITLGDFWGIEKKRPELDDNKGLSFVLINTEKGEALFNSSKSYISYIETPIEWTEQPRLHNPISKPGNSDDFWKFFLKHGIILTANKYIYGGIVRGFLRSIWHKLH